MQQFYLSNNFEAVKHTICNILMSLKLQEIKVYDSLFYVHMYTPYVQKNVEIHQQYSYEMSMYIISQMTEYTLLKII